MKRTKRLISLFLAILMVLGSMTFAPLAVKAQGQEPPQWVKDQINPDLTGDLIEPGAVKFYDPIIEEDPNIANKWTAQLLVAARDSEETSDIVLVIDTSGSMKDQGRMKAAKDAANAFVANLLPSSTTKIAIVDFASEAIEASPLTNEANTLNTAINDRSAGGGTFTQGGIHKAREILKNSHANNKYIVVLSDGEPTYSYGMNNPTSHATNLFSTYNFGNHYETTSVIPEEDFTKNIVGRGGSLRTSIGSSNRNYYYYNHGNSAIAEASFAKNDKIEVFSIGLQTETLGSGVLEQIASDKNHFTEVTDVKDLTSVFEKIAGAIAVAAKDASAIPTTTKGFQYAFEEINENQVKTSSGSNAVIEGGNLNWTMDKVQTVYDTNNPSIKYEYLTFEFELNDDILKVGNQNDVAPLEGLTFTYTDAEGKSQSKTAKSPKVNPIIVSVTKKVTDNDGGAPVDIDQREFTFKAKDQNSGELDDITLIHDQSKILKNMKKGETYTVYESAKGKAYNEDKSDSKEFDVSAYYQDFKTTLNGTDQTSSAPTDGIGNSATTSKIVSGGDKEEIVFTNTEYTDPLAKVTLTKILEKEEKAASLLFPAQAKEEAKKFKITFTKKSDPNSTRPGDKVEFNLNAGESQRNDKMRFTTYVITEDTKSAKPYAPKEGEQDKEVKITLYDVLAGGTDGQKVNFTNIFDPEAKIDFTAEKIWEVPTDFTLKDEDYPTMNFTLYRKVKGGEEAAVQNSVKEITKITKTAEWKELPAFDDKGNEYTYSVKETFDDTDVKNDNWITGEMVTDEDGNNTITNELKKVVDEGEPNPEKNPVGKLTIKKVFENEPVKKANTMTLMNVSDPLVFKFKVTGPYGYEKTFELAAGEEKELKNLYYGEYTVKETVTHGFVPSYSQENGKAILKVGEAEKTIIVTNTNKGETATDPTNVTITVNKVWDGGTKPATEIELWRKGQNAVGTTIDEQVNKFTTTAGQDSSQEFTTKEDKTPLAKYDPSGREFEYYAKEPNVPANYKSEVEGLTVNNTYEIPKDGSFTATKVWSGDEKVTRPTMNFELWRKVGDTDEKVDNQEIKTVDGTNTTATWDKLETTNQAGDKYTFYVKETFKETDVKNDNWKLGDFDDEAKSITNTVKTANDGLGKLTIKKVLENEQEATQMRALRSASDPIKFSFEVTGPYNYKETFDLAAGEEKELKNLYYGEYKVEETDSKGYTASYNPGQEVTLTTTNNDLTVTVTNWNIIPEDPTEPEDPEDPVVPNPNILTLTVTKVWEGGPKPATTIELWRTGLDLEGKEIREIVGSFTTIAKGDDLQSHDFTTLAKHDPSGREFTYFVVEENVPENYKAKVEGLKVTNTYSQPAPEPQPEPKPEPKPDYPYIPLDFIFGPGKYDEPEKTHHAYVKGYPQGDFRPEGKMTRAEAVTIIVRLEGYKLGSDKPMFADTVKDGWYNKFINAAYEKGILEEKAGENFRPDEPITRGELARLISVVDKASDLVAPFEDVRGHKYEKFINQAFGNQRILGYPDGTFRPDADITRAEVTAMFNRLYNRKTDYISFEKTVNLYELKKFKDLDSRHWAYFDIMEAANSHKYTRRNSTNDKIVENWNKILVDIFQ